MELDRIPYAAIAPVSTVVETTCSAAISVAGSAIVYAGENLTDLRA